MAETNVTIESPIEIDVTLPNEVKDSGSEKPLFPTHQAKKPFRRKKPKGGINFYDLGQIINNDGITEDLDFYKKPGYTYYPSTTVAEAPLPFTAAYYTQFREKLFEIPVEEWKNKYQILEYELAERYGLDLEINGNRYAVARNNSRLMIDTAAVITNTKWTQDGLKNIENFSNVEIISGAAFERFNTANTTLFKVTSLPTFASPAVVLPLMKNPIFYLVPRVFNITGSSTKNVGGNPPQLQFETLFSNYQLANRALFLANDPWLTVMPLAKYTPSPLGLNSHAIVVRAFNVSGKSALNSDLWFQYGYIVNPHPTPSPSTKPSVDNFGTGYSYQIKYDTIFRKLGTLVGVIENEGEFFYIWTKTDDTYSSIYTLTFNYAVTAPPPPPPPTGSGPAVTFFQWQIHTRYYGGTTPTEVNWYQGVYLKYTPRTVVAREVEISGYIVPQYGEPYTQTRYFEYNSSAYPGGFPSEVGYARINRKYPGYYAPAGEDEFNESGIDTLRVRDRLSNGTWTPWTTFDIVYPAYFVTYP